MKTTKHKILIPAGIIAVFLLLLSVNGFSQKRKLPDGTIIYSDGTKKLPNDIIVYKNGTVRKAGTTAKLPGGSVILPDGSRRYPNHRSYNRRYNGKRLPPGQAKKIYGGSARDYAPGQQKKWKKNRNEWREDEHKGKYKNHGKGKD